MQSTSSQAEVEAEPVTCKWETSAKEYPLNKGGRHLHGEGLQPENIHLTKRRGICADHQASFYIECMR